MKILRNVFFACLLIISFAANAQTNNSRQGSAKPTREEILRQSRQNAETWRNNKDINIEETTNDTLNKVIPEQPLVEPRVATDSSTIEIVDLSSAPDSAMIIEAEYADEQLGSEGGILPEQRKKHADLLFKENHTSENLTTEKSELQSYDNKQDVAEPAVETTDTNTENSSNDNITLKRKKAQIERQKLMQESDFMTLEEKDELRRMCSVNESTMFGVGGSGMKDTYLSQGKYGGVDFRLINERMRLMSSTNCKMSRQQLINVDISSTINGARNANFLSAFFDYSIGYHYRLHPSSKLKILLGGSAHTMLGMVYHTRNGNNPMTVHADVDLNVSAAAIYNFNIKKSRLTLRYQFDTPFAGFMFSPVYDQSYYEIFSLGNTSGIINFVTFDKKLAMRHYLTLDFPIGAITFRVGYLHSYYSTSVNNIDRYIKSQNFIIGFAKEFVALGGRDIKKRNMFKSAFY